jgi:hypothetical protein
MTVWRKRRIGRRWATVSAMRGGTSKIIRATAMKSAMHTTARLMAKATLRSHLEAVSARFVKMSGVAMMTPLRMLRVTASEEFAPRSG